MHQAHRADSGRHSAGSTSRVSKFLAAGVAVVGAGAIAATPVSPVLDDVKIQAQTQRAVALTAAANPFTEFQNFIAETQLNLALLQINATNSQDRLSEVLADADLFGQFVDFVTLNATDPSVLFDSLVNFGSTYGDDLEVVFFGREAADGVTAYDGVFDRIQEAFELFGPTIQNILTYDENSAAKGVFNQALFEANRYFVLNILDILRPLSQSTPAGIVPLLSIPGDFIGGLPGGETLGALVNAAGEQGAARAIIGPVLTAGFQLAKILDDTQAAVEDGDFELAANELVNLPIRVTNAFVNGFTPDFSNCNGTADCTGEWPSLLAGASLATGSNTAPGGLQYALVTATNDLIRALGGTPPTLVTQLPPTAPTGAGARSNALAADAPEVEFKAEPAPEAPKKEDEGASTNPATLVSSNTPAANADTKEIVEGEGAEDSEDAKATPAKKGYKPGDGIKAIKKAGDDIRKDVRKNVKSLRDSLKPKKSTSGKSDADSNGGGSNGGGSNGGGSNGGGGNSGGGGESGS